MKKQRATPNNQQGFSLVEVLVAAGLLAILSLFLVTAIEHGFMGMKGVDNRQTVASTLNQIRQVVWQQNICTGNLRDSQIALNVPIEVTKLENYNDNLVKVPGTALFDIVEEHKKTNGAYVDKMEIVAKSQISKTLYLGEILLTFETKGAGTGPSHLTRTFPVSISIDESSNKLVQCGSIESTVVGEDKICAVSSNGQNYYDPETKSCKSRFESSCVYGNNDTATCTDPDTTPSPLGSQNCFQAGNDSFPKVSRTYKNGATTQFSPPPFQYSLDGNNVGHCNWAADVDSSGWVCGIRCDKPIHF